MVQGITPFVHILVNPVYGAFLETSFKEFWDYKINKNQNYPHKIVQIACYSVSYLELAKTEI